MSGTKRGWDKRRLTLFDYIVSKIIPAGIDDCWNWKGTKEGRYGFFQYNYYTRSAHIAVYEYCFGKVPEGLIVRHKCDNTRCVNPRHLETGTKKDNRRDFMERHPKARQIMLKAARIGAKGVKRRWDSMSEEERKAFKKRNIQKATQDGKVKVKG